MNTNKATHATIGIVGLGTTESKVATIVRQNFNANLIAYDPYVMEAREPEIYPRVKRDEIESAGITLVGKDGLFESASILTMYVPLTPKTRSMVGTEEFEEIEEG